MNSALSIAASVREGRATASESIVRSLATIRSAKKLNATTAVFENRARLQATVLDNQQAAGLENGPLAGVPFAAKNLFDVEGIVTRAGSRISENDQPAKQDAFAVQALENAGAILVASTNMDELAYGFTGENFHDGDTQNPHAVGFSAGGSSSGSAALVACGAVPLALGTDTNGSIRVPAALSGICGLKPTYGRVSTSGVYSFVDSLDHVGLLARSVGDLSAAFAALDNAGGRCATLQMTGDVSSFTTKVPNASILGGYFSDPVDCDAAEVVDVAAEILNAADTVELTLAEKARAAAFLITNSESGNRHLTSLARVSNLFGPLVRARLQAGALVPAVWIRRAQKLRRLVCSELARLHETADVLIAPATPCPTFPLGTETLMIAGRQLPIRLAIGMFTQPLTLTGVPIGVVSMCGKKSGLPVGVQIVGRPNEEILVLRAMGILEKAGFKVESKKRETADA